jgi:hypothetical protein
VLSRRVRPVPPLLSRWDQLEASRQIGANGLAGVEGLGAVMIADQPQRLSSIQGP